MLTPTEVAVHVRTTAKFLMLLFVAPWRVLREERRVSVAVPRQRVAHQGHGCFAKHGGGNYNVYVDREVHKSKG